MAAYAPVTALRQGGERERSVDLDGLLADCAVVESEDAPFGRRVNLARLLAAEIPGLVATIRAQERRLAELCAAEAVR